MTEPTLPPASQVVGAGVYDLSEAEYHARPELSSTDARKLLAPSCPALYRYERDHGQPSKRVWEIGSAAHKLVLGTGPDLVLVDKPRWDTNEIKAKLADIRADGGIPLKRPEYDAVQTMANALAAHPFAAKLFEEGTGQAEQTLIWQDKETGVMCRALLDWLRNPLPGYRMVVPDYKSCASAEPGKFARAMAEHGYHIQLAWYLAGVRALNLGDDQAVGLLVAQEKTPPYLVTVLQPDPTAMRMGEIRMREALRTYAECVRDDRWPGYADDVVLAELPPWETKELKGEVW